MSGRDFDQLEFSHRIIHYLRGYPLLNQFRKHVYFFLGCVVALCWRDFRMIEPFTYLLTR